MQAGNNSLESVADSCYRSLEQLDSVLLGTLEESIRSCVEGGSDNKMKEIGGLGDRLSGLEQQQKLDTILTTGRLRQQKKCCTRKRAEVRQRRICLRWLVNS